MKKNENYPKYVQAMRLMDEGYTLDYIEKHLKTCRKTIKLARQRYLSGGELALIQPHHQPQVSFGRKLQIVREVDEKQVSLPEVAYKHLILPQTLRRWVKAYHQSGETGLVNKRAANSMKKKRQLTESELDELEILRRRNEYLEAENALLKKVKALVEEREARLRAIGRGPSKN